MTARTVTGNRRRYFGYCADIDQQIARVLAALRDNGLEDETIVIFTTDYGDMWLHETGHPYAKVIEKTKKDG